MLSSKQACAEHFNYFIKNLLLVTRDYSMIEATRPEPTVLPPSRYLNTVLWGILYGFRCQKWHKCVGFGWCIFIFWSSWHQNGTTKYHFNLIIFIFEYKILLMIITIAHIYLQFASLSTYTVSTLISSHQFFLLKCHYPSSFAQSHIKYQQIHSHQIL